MSILVSIHCITYNHAKYIRRSLDGFLMQKTNFDYKIVVHDDASTDGTSEIIREYYEMFPTKIVPIIQKENQYKKVGFSGIFHNMLPYLEGKYIAFCEGDDYWIDPYKLQKQVNLLEQNPNATLVHTGFDTVDEDEHPIDRPEIQLFMDKSRSGDVFYQLIKNNYIMTLTTMIRKSVYESGLFLKSPIMDYSTSLACASTGDVLYLPEHTACYRKQPAGFIVSRQNSVNKKLSEIRDYYLLAFVKKHTKPQGFYNTIALKYILFKDSIFKAKKGDSTLLKDVFSTCTLSFLILTIPCICGLVIDKFKVAYCKYEK